MKKYILNDGLQMFKAKEVFDITDPVFDEKEIDKWVLGILDADVWRFLREDSTNVDFFLETTEFKNNSRTVAKNKYVIENKIVNGIIPLEVRIV